MSLRVPIPLGNLAVASRTEITQYDNCFHNSINSHDLPNTKIDMKCGLFSINKE